MLVQIHAAHVQDLVAVYHATALIHGQAAVGIAVIGKTHVQALLHHVALQALHMRGAAVDVDVKPSGAALITRTSAPSASNTGLATEDAEPLAQSRPILTPCSEKFELAMSEAI